MTRQARALEGVKVLDLSRVLAGPWCTQILADFGADVLKIEEPKGGDDTRTWGPPNLEPEIGETGPGRSAYYLSCNRNKRSIAVNIATPEGAALIRKLAEKADIVVENFKLGGLTRYGLDYERLKAVNPRLIYCSITGFGQDGPYADRPGYDFVAQAMGGMLSITGEPDGQPMKPGVAIADVSTGMYATVSILMALRHAERTGQGQYIDCSLLDTQISMLANQALNYLVSGVPPKRMGNFHPTVVPYGVFNTSTGPLVIAVGNDRQFVLLCKVLGVPELATDPRYSTNSNRVINRTQLEAKLNEILKAFTMDDLKDKLPANGVPGGPVNNLEQIFNDPFIEARGVVHHFDRTDGVKVPSVAYPGKLSETPARFESPPPLLGEHTLEGLADWLGLESAELADLEGAGAILQRSAR
ncbi:L-carnitine dehydratase/bile acid-inducible protein F [alpha proteobacterium U9-1i]|nr:L-carnitine dehydratase/bile acid-inducible protein F [alpha proteobacterium U9-1i]